ncbi:hypothetical protein ACJ41O_010246 [Fusarium nematophilum]
MSWTKKSSKGKVLPPPSFSMASVEPNDDEKPALNGGADDALRVTKLLEESGIPCCLVGISALIFYGADRVRPDWEICVPTELVDKAAQLLQSEPLSTDYCLVEPWAYPSTSLLHTYHRFKGRGTNFYFILVPSRDVHIACEPSNLTRSLKGLPYPKLDVFIQSCLDKGDDLELCDVVDGTNLPEEWGEENLELDGINDVEWARDVNRRGREFENGKFAHWSPFVYGGSKSRRKMWQDKVRTKKDRLDWTKPSDIFVTQHRLVDMPDPWTAYSDLPPLCDEDRRGEQAAANHQQEAENGWPGRSGSRAILSYYELMGSIQERMFVDIGESGQVVGVDIVLSGQLNTPVLGEDETFEMIQPSFRTPQGNQVPVIHLTWQVEGKLSAWISRRKDSDFTDLRFLFRTFRKNIRDWSGYLNLQWRQEFYEVFKLEANKEERKEMKRTLCLDGSGASHS